MKCPACGFENYPSARYCAACHRTAEPAPTQTLTTPVVSEPPPRRVVPVGLVVLCVVLVGLLGAGVILFLRLWPPDPSTPNPVTPIRTASAQEQAGSIEALLDRSAASRAKLNRAIQQVQGCKELAGALADMRSVGVERTGQIADTGTVVVSALPDGERVRTSLKAALGYALEADRAFVAWAEPTVADGCAETPARRTAWAQGQASSAQAQTAKKQLIAVWNPIAAQFGFKQRTTQAI